MDHHQLSPPTVHTQNFYQLSTIYLFVYEILFHTHQPTPMSKLLETKDERMSDQSNYVQSSPRNFGRNKQTEIVRTHKAPIRLQVVRCNFWTDRQQQQKRNTALNMDRRNIMNPAVELV